MPPAFNFKGYVLSVIDSKRICIRVDSEDIESVSTRLSLDNNYKTTIKDTVVVNVKDCVFSISIGWNELIDLIGIHVQINATLRRYNYTKTKVIYDDQNNPTTTMVQCKGISISAKKITNIT